MKQRFLLTRVGGPLITKPKINWFPAQILSQRPWKRLLVDKIGSNYQKLWKESSEMRECCAEHQPVHKPVHQQKDPPAIRNYVSLDKSLLASLEINDNTTNKFAEILKIWFTSWNQVKAGSSVENWVMDGNKVDGRWIMDHESWMLECWTTSIEITFRSAWFHSNKS